VPQNQSGPRGEEKNLALSRLELRPLGRPAPSQSLYRLSKKVLYMKLTDAGRGTR
jgi:hypothetical protein